MLSAMMLLQCVLLLSTLLSSSNYNGVHASPVRPRSEDLLQINLSSTDCRVQQTVIYVDENGPSESVLTGNLEVCGAGGSSIDGIYATLTSLNTSAILRLAIESNVSTALPFFTGCISVVDSLQRKIGGAGVMSVQYNAEYLKSVFEEVLDDWMETGDWCLCLTGGESFPSSPENEFIIMARQLFHDVIRSVECFFGEDGWTRITAECSSSVWELYEWILAEDDSMSSDCLDNAGKRHSQHLYFVDVAVETRLVLDSCESSIWPAIDLFRVSEDGALVEVRSSDDSAGRPNCGGALNNGEYDCSTPSREVALTEWLRNGSYVVSVQLERDRGAVYAPNGTYSIRLSLGIGNITVNINQDDKCSKVTGLGAGPLVRSTALMHNVRYLDIVPNRTLPMRNKFGGLEQTMYQNGITVEQNGIRTDMWSELVYCPFDGKIYGFPIELGAIVVIDPISNSTSLISTNWTGAHVGFAYCEDTRKLYSAPRLIQGAYQFAAVVFDPSTNESSEIAYVPGFHHIQGCSQTYCWVPYGEIVYAPNVRKFVVVPQCAPGVLVIDPYTNASNPRAIPKNPSEPSNECPSIQYYAAEFAPNTGYIYAAPIRGNTILEIDPIRNRSTGIEIPQLNYPHRGHWWTGIAYAPSVGLLFASPGSASAVLVVNPLHHSADSIGNFDSTMDAKWTGIVFSSSTGLLYLVPGDEASVLIIDPTSNITTRLPPDRESFAKEKYSAPVFVPNFDTVFAAARRVLFVGNNLRSWQQPISVVAIVPAIDPCTVGPGSACARLCASDACGWDPIFMVCRSGIPTPAAALTENWGRVSSCSPFALSNQCETIVQAQLNDWAQNQHFVAGSSTMFPEFSQLCSSRSTLFVNPTAGDFSGITYQFVLSPSARMQGGGSVADVHNCIDPQTGSVTLKNLQAGDFVGTLIAIDGWGQSVEVYSVQLPVRAYKFRMTENCSILVSNFIRQAENSEYYVNESTRIDGFGSQCDRFHGFEGTSDSSTITFLLNISTAFPALPKWSGDMLVDAATALMTIFLHVTGRYIAKLTAVDNSNRPFIVANWSFRVRRRQDTYFNKNGPNQKGCGKGKQVDAIEYDNMFECNCEGTGLTGDNCDTSSSNEHVWHIVPVFIFLVFFSLLTFGLVRSHKRRRKKEIIKAELKKLISSRTVDGLKLTSGLFQALDYSFDEIALKLIDKGSLVHQKDISGMLPHAKVLSRTTVNTVLLKALFEKYCEIDRLMGAMMADQSKFSAVHDAIVSCARPIPPEQPRTDGSPLLQVVWSCQRKDISVKHAVELARSIIQRESSLLLSTDSSGRSPGYYAMQCTDAVELELLVTTIVHGVYQLPQPNELLYKSPTAVVMDCRDLGLVLKEKQQISKQRKLSQVLKLMTDEESWNREMEVRNFLGSGTQSAVVPILSASSLNKRLVADKDGILRNRIVPVGDSITRITVNFEKQYKFALVMEKAERSLFEIINNERLAEEPLIVIRSIAINLCKCVETLHDRGIIHGDIKPRNIVRLTSKNFKLIDLDLAFANNNTAYRRRNQNINFQSKMTSTSAYISPEVAQVVLNCRQDMQLGLCQSYESYDMWGLGCTLFEMVTGGSLISNSCDRATRDGQIRLLEWNGLERDDLFQSKQRSDGDVDGDENINRQDSLSYSQFCGHEGESLFDLLSWTLEADPEKRPKNMKEVLSHAFFDPENGKMRVHFVVDRIRELLLAKPTTPRPLKKVFISYCWNDDAFVLDKLCLQLASRVEDMWLDRLGGENGIGEWTKESICRGIEECDIVIAVVSPAYVKSNNCGFELKKAVHYEKKIVPIKLGLPDKNWPPTVIGATKMTSQFMRTSTDDLRLYVDFEKKSLFKTKFRQELEPMLTKTPRRRLSRETGAEFRKDEAFPDTAVLGQPAFFFGGPHQVLEDEHHLWPPQGSDQTAADIAFNINTAASPMDTHDSFVNTVVNPLHTKGISLTIDNGNDDDMHETSV